MQGLGYLASLSKINVNEKLAADAGIKNATVRCDNCGKTLNVDGAQCLAKGFPVCCHYTMRLVKNV